MINDIQIINDHISKLDMVKILDSNHTVFHENLNDILTKLGFTVNHFKSGSIFKIELNHNRYLHIKTFFYNSKSNKNFRENATFIIQKTYFNSKGLVDNGNKPAMIDYTPDGRLDSLKYYKSSNLYKYITYSYDSNNNIDIEKTFYVAKSIICKNICLNSLSSVKNAIIDASFSTISKSDKENKTFKLDTLLECCPRFSKLTKNEFLEMFNTLNSDEINLIHMSII